MIPPPGAFAIARLPRIVFGAGTVSRVAKEAAAFGRHALVVTGAKSFRATSAWPALLVALEAEGLAWSDVAVDGEPSPDMVDEAIAAYRDTGIDVVIGIGGGSALDAAKAIAGLLPHGRSVLEHLEGVGPERPYDGPALPLVAVPTTAGTGSEATKNAVLTRQGPDGFKKSFRDEQLVARVAIVDPELLAPCPRNVVAANGMDAFTQLLESYTSINANALTDALAWSGMAAFRDGFFDAWDGGDSAKAEAGRSRMAYASLISGICLAQTGLGAVHGLASPLGAYFPIPHGACCGTLVAAATKANIDALTERDPDNPALIKYAAVSDLLTMTTATDRSEGLDVLVSTLAAWTERLNLPRLSRFGMGEEDIGRVVAGSRGSSMKTNPIVLTDQEVAAIVRDRL